METETSDVLTSTLADDPDLGEIVRLYASEMPDRIAALVSRYQSGDRAGLATLAHQLKGAAGSHGFHPITPYAATVEQLARANATEEKLRPAFEALIEICGRVR
jgi:HPt (histidine-containing phosphotransfer) domain-containing protein